MTHALGFTCLCILVAVVTIGIARTPATIEPFPATERATLYQHCMESYSDDPRQCASLKPGY